MIGIYTSSSSQHLIISNDSIVAHVLYKYSFSSSTRPQGHFYHIALFCCPPRTLSSTPTKVTIISRTMGVVTKNRTAKKVDPDALLDSPCPVLGSSLKATLAYNQKIGPYLPPFQITTFTFLEFSNSISQPLSIPVRWGHILSLLLAEVPVLYKPWRSGRSIFLRIGPLRNSWVLQAALGQLKLF